MKKQIFLLSLLSLSLFSCGNNNPEPQPTDEYTVNEQEMKDAFAMKGVEYLQCVDIAEGLQPRNETYALTPTSYHFIQEREESYSETLVIKKGDQYYQYERESKDASLEPVTYEGYFITPADLGNLIFSNWKNSEYKDFYYSAEKKEYLSYTTKGSKVLIGKFKFCDKKIISHFFYDGVRDNPLTENISFSYDKIEPPSPTI
ncbi:MAG: hypothetical protein MJ208_03310 [Bacilli bacterium]|nr:hypothetical protein [Bacilli bacterium]